MAFLLKFLYTQLFVTPSYPTQPFTSQTVIVTGSNVGLGLEAARHLVRLGASKVILAVRSTSKGEAAKTEIEASTSRTGVVEVWPLDLSSYESVKEFAKRAEGLERLDAVVENAGVIPNGSNFELSEDNETTITVNVVSTFLLALLLMPVLRRTATKFNTQPRLVIVSSEVHAFTSFPERKSENIFATLNDKKKAVISDRYNVSKLLEVLVVYHIAPILAKPPATPNPPHPMFILNTLNPGLCHSSLTRNAAGISYYIVEGMKALIARTTEVGSRTLVHAAGAGDETHGKYLSDSTVADPSPFVKSEEGSKAGARVWAELAERLEKIQPGVTKNLEG